MTIRWGLRQTPWGGWKGYIKVYSDSGMPIHEETGYGEQAHEALGDAAEAVDVATDLTPGVSEAKATLKLIKALSQVMKDKDNADKIKKHASTFGRFWKMLSSSLSGSSSTGRSPVVLPFGMTRIPDILPGIRPPAHPDKVEGLLGIINGMCY